MTLPTLVIQTTNLSPRLETDVECLKLNLQENKHEVIKHEVMKQCKSTS